MSLKCGASETDGPSETHGHNETVGPIKTARNKEISQVRACKTLRLFEFEERKRPFQLEECLSKFDMWKL